MSENQKFIIINVLISASIGVAVGIVDLLIPHLTAESYKVILFNALVGITIGTSIRSFSVYVWDNISRNQMMIYASFILSAIILGVEGLASLILGSEFFHFSTLATLFVAGTLGLSWTYYSYNYYDKMNCQLYMKKKEFMDAQQDGSIDLESK